MTSAQGKVEPDEGPVPASLISSEALSLMVAFLLHCALHSAQAMSLDFESLALWLLLWQDNQSTDEGMSPAGEPYLRPSRIRGLVERSGIPRETVRRKLVGLQQTGRVARVTGGWIVERSALAELDAYTVNCVAMLHRTIQTMPQTPGARADEA